MATDLMFSADAERDDPPSPRSDDSRFALCRVSSIEWVIVDTTLPPANPSRVIACVYEFDRLEYGVVWLGELELRAEYGSPQDVLDDAHRAVETRHHRSERPIAIPHLPPAAHG
jgi:hypothetical protein